jgi:hypothetical protein
MSSTVRRSATVISAVALAVSLTSCTDRSTPPVDPTSPRSTHSTATPSPTSEAIAKPERPDAADTATVDGAIAAAKYFMALSTYTRQTNDLTEWTAMSADDCAFCNALAASVARVKAANHTIDGAAIEIIDATGSEIIPDQVYSAKLRVHEAPALEIDAEGNELSASSGSVSDLLVALTWSSGWSIKAIDVSPTPTAS